MTLVTLLIASAWYAAMSTVCFVAYALDKRAARRGAWRIPERTLHGLEFIGGWPGALAAAAWLRHKSSKLGYRVVRALIIALHVAGWGLALWLSTRASR